VHESGVLLDCILLQAPATVDEIRREGHPPVHGAPGKGQRSTAQDHVIPEPTGPDHGQLIEGLQLDGEQVQKMLHIRDAIGTNRGRLNHGRATLQANMTALGTVPMTPGVGYPQNRFLPGLTFQGHLTFLLLS